MSFNATTIVAGTTNASICVNMPCRYVPMNSTPDNVAPAPPSPVVIIKIADTIRNSFVSLPVTFRKPTIKPKTTSSDASIGVAAPKETMPRTIAIITPIINE